MRGFSNGLDPIANKTTHLDTDEQRHIEKRKALEIAISFLKGVNYIKHIKGTYVFCICCTI